MQYELNEPPGRHLVFVARRRPKPDKLVSKIINFNLNRVEERNSLVRKMHRRWPAVWLTLFLTPFLPIAAKMAPSILMIAMTCGRPLETEKKENY